jgi:hypothetical protein
LRSSLLNRSKALLVFHGYLISYMFDTVYGHSVGLQRIVCVGVVWSAVLFVSKMPQTDAISSVMKHIAGYHTPKIKSRPSVLRYALSQLSKEGLHVIG